MIIMMPFIIGAFQSELRMKKSEGRFENVSPTLLSGQKELYQPVSPGILQSLYSRLYKDCQLCYERCYKITQDSLFLLKRSNQFKK